MSGGRVGGGGGDGVMGVVAGGVTAGHWACLGGVSIV